MNMNMFTMNGQREHLTRRMVLLITPSMIDEIDRRAVKGNISRAEVIRQAVRKELKGETR
jgi:metal-responsive CopG/Arc/MetJ family transcriptional regulator